jgi:hypothetical protein
VQMSAMRGPAGACNADCPETLVSLTAGSAARRGSRPNARNAGSAAVRSVSENGSRGASTAVGSGSSLRRPQSPMHGQTLEAAAADQSTPRTLDCVEFFCGVGAIVQAARMAGRAAEGFDIKRVPGVTDQPGPNSEDITTKSGFLVALNLLQRVRVGGLVWFAPPCGSFNWLCRHQSRRSAENSWEGDQAKVFVQTGNQTALASNFLATVASARGLFFVLENPPRSLLWRYLSSCGADEGWIHAALCDRCAFAAGKLAGQSEIRKTYRLVGNAPWIAALGLRCRCEPTVKHAAMTQVFGSKRRGVLDVMGASAAYPAEMGEFVVKAWTGEQRGRPDSLGCGGDDDSPCSRSWASAPLARPRQHSSRSRPWPDAGDRSGTALPSQLATLPLVRPRRLCSPARPPSVVGDRAESTRHRKLATPPLARSQRMSATSPLMPPTRSRSRSPPLLAESALFSSSSSEAGLLSSSCDGDGGADEAVLWSD